MKLNEFENKQLHQINKIDKQLNEGSFGNALLRLMFGSKFKKAMKTAIKDQDDFPEYKAAMDALEKNMEDLLASTKRAQQHAKLMSKSKK
jgi:hypothetical protein